MSGGGDGGGDRSERVRQAVCSSTHPRPAAGADALPPSRSSAEGADEVCAEAGDGRSLFPGGRTGPLKRKTVSATPALPLLHSPPDVVATPDAADLSHPVLSRDHPATHPAVDDADADDGIE